MRMRMRMEKMRIENENENDNGENLTSCLGSMFFVSLLLIIIYYKIKHEAFL